MGDWTTPLEGQVDDEQRAKQRGHWPHKRNCRCETNVQVVGDLEMW